MLKISVLVSGGGTNLQALINAQNNGILSSGKIVQVISSRHDAYALERAKHAGIPAEVVEAGSENFEGKILELLRKFQPEVIVLAGFMHILSKNFIDQCGAKIINVHPSLIPSFCGKGYYGLKVHEAVLKSGVKVTGATVHLVNEIPDGGEILAQKPVKIFPDDTPEKLQRRVMEQAEWVILPRAVEEVCKKLKPKIFASPIKYPGRGIITGMTPSGKIMLAYFIMGRSASSKARIFERSGDDLIIKLTNQPQNFDSSLILYSPLRVLGKNIILTNGDQTDTIYDFINAGKNCENRRIDNDLGKNCRTDDNSLHTGKNSHEANDCMNSGENCQADDDFLHAGKIGRTDTDFMNAKDKFIEALRTREYEPDAPHYTPRISALITEKGYAQSILKHAGKYFYEYEFVKGTGRLIHTYDHDVMPSQVLPSFMGEPREVRIDEDINEFANSLWEELGESYRVALYVRYYEPDFVNYTDKLFNTQTL